MNQTKICSKCKLEKSINDFAKDSRSKDKKRHLCRRCDADKELKRKRGISIEDYEKLLDSQNGVCAICSSVYFHDKRTKRFCVDHEHTTGNVRGLLCSKCNRAIGMLRDDPNVLSSAINYLTSNPNIEKVKIVRESGRPIDLADIDKFERERKDFFDEEQKKHFARCAEGVDPNESMKTWQEMLESNDKILAKKYDTISEIDLPNNPIAAKNLVEKYGSYLVSTHKDTGEIIFVIMDMGM